jgi:hypothetical protein
MINFITSATINALAFESVVWFWVNMQYPHALLGIVLFGLLSGTFIRSGF